MTGTAGNGEGMPMTLHERVVRLKLEGLGNGEIADLIGRSDAYVRAAWRRHTKRDEVNAWERKRHHERMADPECRKKRNARMARYMRERRAADPDFRTALAAANKRWREKRKAEAVR